MGCFPYFVMTGTHPLLPFDIAEANYLLPPPDSPLWMTDLIAWWVIALQKQREHLTELHRKVHTACLKAAIQFEKDHSHTIRDYNFKSGDLILIRNTAIKKALNWKMWAHYLGPLIVVSCNKGGAYIIAKLDGSVFDRLVAAFRVIPYFAHTSIMIPPLDELLDISWSCLIQMEQSMLEDPEEEDDNYASEDEVLADDWGQSRVKLGGGMGQRHVWTLFFTFHFSIFFLFTFWTIIHLLWLWGLLSRYTSHNFYRLAQSFGARAMNGSEPLPQNSKYFQQKQKKFIAMFYIFSWQFYFQNFIDIGRLIILANTTTKTVTRNKRTRYFARKGVTMADQKDNGRNRLTKQANDKTQATL